MTAEGGEPLRFRWQYGRIVPMPEAVPPGWDFVRLTDVARLESGHTPSRKHPEYWAGDIPWVSLHDTKVLDRPDIKDTAQTIGELGLENSSARLLPSGTVVFSRTATVGKATILGREMATSQDFANYVCGPRLWNKYLLHLLRFLQPEWKRLMAGSTHNTIYMPVFESLQALLPPLGEQKRIATILSSVDEAIEATQAVIDQLQVVKKAMMAELLTMGLPGRHTRFKQTEIGELPEEWTVGPLEDLLASIDAGWSPQCDSRPADDHEWGVLKVSAVSWGEFRQGENKRLPDGLAPRPQAEVRVGDLLVSRANTPELVGRCVLVHETRPRLMMSDKLLRLRVKETRASAGFVRLALETPCSRQQIEDGATGSSRSMKNISQEKLRALLVPQPPRDEQVAISRSFDVLAERARSEEAALDASRALKSALMSVLLTGEVRVKRDEEAA